MSVSSIAILDCGGQYTKVIDRRVRETCIRSEIHRIDTPAKDLAAYDAFILSGGPESVYAPGAPHFDAGLLDLGKPILGICYGMQLLAQALGGDVVPGGTGEYGVESVAVSAESALYAGLPERQAVLMSHGDQVSRLPEGFVISARSATSLASIEHAARRIYAVQFHPEVDLTEHGQAILRNFIDQVCRLPHNYVLEDRIAAAEQAIRAQVGQNPVVVLVSGGVDSAVSAVLLLRALGPQNVHALHVDHGLMRKDESDETCRAMAALGLDKLVRIDAKEAFFGGTTVLDGKTVGPLARMQDAEHKRVIIGEAFIKVLNEHIARLGLDPDNTFFAQGTLRPDLIESGNPQISSIAHKIKTHHNDVELVRRARARGHVVETNADWHKDEVRKVARTLGIPAHIAERHPFPGPGLALRVMTYDGQERASAEEQEKLDRLLRETGAEVSGTVVPIRTVGVQGDFRTYRHLAVVAGRGHGWQDAPRISQHVTNGHGNVNRVAWVVGGCEELARVRVAECYLDETSVGLVREVDAVVRKRLEDVKLSQVLAILVPIGLKRRFSVAIRTFITNDFMTGRFAVPGQDFPASLLDALADEIRRSFAEIDLVLYDVTSKPPATVEWQ